MARLSKFRSDDARDAYLRLYDTALLDSPIQVTESDVETSFGSTHVLHAGDRSKPSIVALHGSSISSTSWVPLLGTLTASHSVTMIDAIDDAGKSIAAKPTFFSLLQKNVLDRRGWDTREQLRIAIVTWIERTYHRRRRQVGLGRLTPVEFEAIMTTPAHQAA